MVDIVPADVLPREMIEREPITTSEAPRSQLSTADIVGPYQRLAQGLDKLGEGLEKVATVSAEREGAKAVTRDAQGNIQVERAPIFGEAGDAYARAVKVAALAEGDGAAKRADIELREKYRDDPQGYQNAADAYKQKTVEQYTAAAGPEVGNAVGQAIDNTTTYTYRGLLNEKERLDLQRAENSYNAGIKDAADDMMALSRSGASAIRPGTGYKAMTDAMQKWETLTAEKVANPRMAYTQDEADFDRKKLQGQLAGQRFLYHIDQTYKSQGRQAAEDDAKDVLTNRSYTMEEPQRNSIYHQAITDIRANEAIRTQDRQMATMNLELLRDRQAKGDQIDPSEIWDVRHQFEVLNDPGGVLRVDNAFRHADLHDAFGRQPLHDQHTQNLALKGATATRDIYEKFLGLGYRKEEAAAIAASAAYESANRPTAFNPAGGGQGAFGLFQWRGDRLKQLQDYAASKGTSINDEQTQIEFAHRELQTTESFARGLLRTATTPEEAAAAFETAFERGEGRDIRQRQTLARSIYDGKSADGSGGPGARSWEIANREATEHTTAKNLLVKVKQDFDDGRNVSRDDLKDIIDAARDTNDIDLGAKAQQLADAQDYIEQIRTLPLDEQHARETEIRRQLQIDPHAGATLVTKQLEAKTEAIEKGLKDNPISTAIENFPDKFKTPAPLDIKDQQQFMAGLQMRAQIAQFAANNWRVPPVSALDDGDVQVVKAALATPDLAQRAQVWGMLATLPENVRGPTFEKIAKGDPNALAEAGAGAMMATDPVMAKSIMAGLDIMGKNDKGIMKMFEPKAGGVEGFDADLVKNFPTSTFGPDDRTSTEGNWANTAQMIKGRYAFLAARSNASEYSPELTKQAINDVTGGLISTPGGKTVPPSRGMDQTTFDRVMYGITDNDLAGVTDLNGRPVTANYLRAQGGLEAIGPGQYYVNFSRGDPPIYAYRYANTEIPQPFVLDLSRRQPAPIGPVDLSYLPAPSP